MENSPPSSHASGNTIPVVEFNTDDRISKLSTDLLLKILSKLSTEEIVRTSVLSKRWVHVWKETSRLFLDMRRIPNTTTLPSGVIVALDAAESVTKVIRDHRGDLERCTITHYSRQCVNGEVETWIQTLIHLKHVKHLTLENTSETKRRSVFKLNLPPKSLSHPNLKSLSLGGYTLEAPHAFNNAWNLKRLKLHDISTEIGVLNEVLESCTSLEALSLVIIFRKGRGVLKIGNSKLKFLHLSCSKIDGIEVSTHSVDILSVGSHPSCTRENFKIANPRLLQFKRNYWSTSDWFPQTSYDITCSHQEKKSTGHKFMISGSGDYMKGFASMSVSVDLTNTEEVEMLKEVLVAWPEDMGELEILFKNNNPPRKEGECSVGRTHKFWEETRQIPKAYFHAYSVWLCNFSGSQEEFELASHLITQGMVIRSMNIYSWSCSPSKKVEIETVVAKLKKLPNGHKISMWW